MDQPDMLREEIFQIGFEEVCQAYSEKRPLAHQFGLSKNVLAEKTDNFYVHEIREHFPVLNSQEFDLEVFYNSASICLHDFTLLVELGINVAVDIAGFNGLINDRIKLLGNATIPDLKSIVAVYNLAVPYAELFFIVLTDRSHKLEMLNRIEVYLNIMVSLLHASAQHIAFNMQVKHYTNEGDYLQSLNKCSNAESAYQLALTIFEDIMEDNADQVTRNQLLLLFPFEICF
jgi:hypothetical protein